jgi:hypothetical protein
VGVCELSVVMDFARQVCIVFSGGFEDDLQEVSARLAVIEKLAAIFRLIYLGSVCEVMFCEVDPSE